MTSPQLVFVDKSGVDWRIYERRRAEVPAPRGDSCLIFESCAAIRRVWNYPRDWRTLSTEELAALSWGR